MSEPRPLSTDERTAALAVINEAAEAYHGVIPAGCWHEPYMSAQEFDGEVGAGVRFWCIASADEMLGVMGIQDVGDVTLIRHAYVRTRLQRAGIGGELLARLLSLTERPVLVGTWAAASWAIAFYEKNGFALVTPAEKDRLLRAYWDISPRQIETSVVLADRRARTEIVRPA